MLSLIATKISFFNAKVWVNLFSGRIATNLQGVDIGKPAQIALLRSTTMFRKLLSQLLPAALGAAATSPHRFGWLAGRPSLGSWLGPATGIRFSPVIVSGGYADDDGCYRERDPFARRYPLADCERCY